MRSYPAWLLLMSCLLMSGCSYSYHFRIFITIIDAITKQPVEGVQLRINTWGKPDRPDLDHIIAKSTDNLGQCDESLSQSIGDFDRGALPVWYLKVKKPGYTSALIDISPRSKPETYGNKTPTQIFVVLNLQPIK